MLYARSVWAAPIIARTIAGGTLWEKVQTGRFPGIQKNLMISNGRTYIDVQFSFLNYQ